VTAAPGSSATLTCSCIAATLSCKFRICTPEFRVTFAGSGRVSCEVEASSVYSPNVRLENEYAPSLLETVSLSFPEESVKVTFALATTPPDSSVTTPLRVPVCAKAGAVLTISNNR